MGKRRLWAEIEKDIEALINEMNATEAMMGLGMVEKRLAAYRRITKGQVVKEKGFKEGELVDFLIPGSGRSRTGVIEKITQKRDLIIKESNNERHLIHPGDASKIPAPR